MALVQSDNRRMANLTFQSAGTWLTTLGRCLSLGLPLAGLLATSAPSQAQDLSRLQNLLASTPAGGWVKVNTGLYSSAWPTGSVAVPAPTGGPGAIVYSWSGFAWDSNRAEIVLWGGGHANYSGNEIYLWHADTGLWSRGSLPSARNGNYIVDAAAPQSSHTYDGNTFLPVNDLFITFGGPTYNSGEGFVNFVNGVEVKAGPWMWDPTKANPNLVGGTTGSGYDPTVAGGNMWINRQGQWTGTEGPYSPHNTAAYRTENGHDVVYLTMDSWNSLHPALMKYTIGDVRNGGLDKWEWIGVTNTSLVGQGAGTLDTTNNLFVRTAKNGAIGDLAVWDLDFANPNNPNANADIPVHLVQPDGTPFVMDGWYGIDYDAADGQLVLWDDRNQGKVWVTQAVYGPDGRLSTTWVVVPLLSTTAAQPTNVSVDGVLGKWKYVPELGAFMAMDELDATKDAGIWLYKPLPTALTAAVPEPGSTSLMLAGLSVVGLWLRSRRPLRTATGH